MDTRTAEPAPDRPTATAGVSGGALVKTLATGLRALDLLRSRPDVGTVELATALGVDKGAASRLLNTLVASGYAERRPHRRYGAGPKLAAGQRAASVAPSASIKERARPLLHKIHALTGETTSLAIRADDQVLYLDKVVTEFPLRVERPIGTLAPLHCTALGKVILAFDAVPLPPILTSYTDRTSVDLGALQAELARIRAEGFARDDEEFSSGIRCVAAPLHQGPDRSLVGAIGLSGPSIRIAQADLAELGALVVQVAREFPD